MIKKKKTNKKSRLHSRKNQGTPKKIKRKKNKTLKKGGAVRTLEESQETDSYPQESSSKNKQRKLNQFLPHMKPSNYDFPKYTSLRRQT